MFDKWQAQRWWGENYDRIMELYNVQRFNCQALDTPSRSEDGVIYFPPFFWHHYNINSGYGWVQKVTYKEIINLVEYVKSCSICISNALNLRHHFAHKIYYYY